MHVSEIWPAKLGFVFVSMHNTETPKKLDYEQYNQLTQWLSSFPQLTNNMFVSFFVLLLCFYHFAPKTIIYY